MKQETTRQRIKKLLQERPEVRPTAISDALGDHGVEISPEDAVEEVREVNKSIDQQVLVLPPYCRNCGFSDYDETANIPSKCPRCLSEWIEEPKFKIEL